MILFPPESIFAEELRGKVAGYYIDRQIIKSKKSIEDMTEEELDKRLVGIVNDNKHLINNKEKK